MKKLMMVVGVAAVATLVGCKHDEYGAHKIGNKVKPVETVEVAADVDSVSVDNDSATSPSTVAPVAKGDAAANTVPATMAVPADDEGKATTTVVSVPDAPVATTADDAPKGAAKDAGKTAAKDTAKDAPKADAAKDAPAAEPEFTPYVVRGGDTLGGICLRYKVKKADVLALNPGMDPNKIFVGRTIKLPGNIEAAKSAPAPKAAATAKDAGAKKAAAPAAKREYKPYTGETKEYVVKKGDTMGGIAYSNGISIRQFKELNGLKSDFLREGQKVKIPAEKVKSDKPVAVAGDAKEPAKKGPAVLPEKVEQIQPVAADDPAKKAADAKPADAAAAAAPAAAESAASAAEQLPAAGEPAPAAAEAPAEKKYTIYTVKPGDADVYSVAIKWGITASQLKEANGLVDDTLTPGQELKVPAKAE